MTPSAAPAGNGASRSAFIRRRLGLVDALLLPAPGSGLIAAQFIVRRGSADEQPGELGLASFTAGMLKRGTTSRSSARIAFEMESLGAMSSHGAGLDAAESSLRCAAVDFPAALEILVDCMRRPAFDPREFEIERESVLAHLMRTEDEKMGYTYRRYIKRIFACHGYGHSPEGDPGDVRAITPEACRAWHRRAYRPENLLFIAAGDFDPDALCGWLDRELAGWASDSPAGERYALTSPPAAPPGPLELTKPLEQGFQIAGFRTPALTHPDYPALRLASAALGEGFAGRLFTRLRDERSLAYAVGCSLYANRLCGHTMLYIGTQPERLDEALEGLLSEARALGTEDLTADDLRRARNYVAGKYLMGHQSLGARVGYLARWEDAGGGAEQDALFLDRLAAVTAADIRAAIGRWWTDPVVVTLRPEPAPAPAGR